MGDKERQRLDKVLSHIGIGSRKEIKSMARAGRLSLNGEVIRQADIHVQPYQDAIEVDGKKINYRKHIYLMMNKPPGVISATEDTYDKVVIDLLSSEHKAFEPFPVGRLDKDTEGLLLLTNDGKLAHRLLSPKKHVPKIYYAKINSDVTADDVGIFRQGVTLDDGYRTLPGDLVIKKGGPMAEIELTIYEGKFHQVKRMFEAIGKKVVYLKRLSMGPLTLDNNLEAGSYRELTDNEISMLVSTLN